MIANVKIADKILMRFIFCSPMLIIACCRNAGCIMPWHNIREAGCGNTKLIISPVKAFVNVLRGFILSDYIYPMFGIKSNGSLECLDVAHIAHHQV